ncbi:MAG TPA: MaoC family dehydratase N-terminal domain-containing protein [Anaeromyxobacteraceae bacterium]|nr:MaoC family dehydratase N-terminal domain-containing protein [Anaeromyxobacteraceae bacterium]
MIEARHLGRSYGPFRYAVGEEEIHDFAAVLAGRAPGRAFFHEPGPGEAGPGAPSRPLATPPTYCVRFAIEPFARACRDPELGLDLARLLHGEQILELLEEVAPGDVFTTRGELTRVWEKAGMDFFTVRTTSVNQHGRLAVVGTFTAVVLPKR